MGFNSKKRWVGNLILGLTIFLIFCLLFETHIKPPAIVSWLGHWHPVILHFPIVLIILAVVLNLSREKLPHFLLTLACLAALLTSITGFFLGLGSQAKGDLLFWHQWLGAGVALTAAAWYWLDAKGYGQHMATKVLGIAILFLIGFAGHYGGMITHGEDFLALPGTKRPANIPDNPLVYEHIVGRILETNCIKCHNPNKNKGELLMGSLQELLEGGESGNTLLPGEPENSELIRRLNLPAEDEEHMPPEGESPLSVSEIQILEQWIALGASDSLRLNHLDPTEPLALLIREMMAPDPLEQWAKLPIVADSTLVRLSSDYLTITRVASASNALRVAMFSPPVYEQKTLLNLKPISNNIVELDLSGLPLSAEEMAFAASCKNLEWLEIDRTPLSDLEVDTLKTLSKLRLLKIFETKIGNASIDLFKEWENLQQLYLWDTNVSQDAIEALKISKPELLINRGIEDSLKTYFIGSDSISKPQTLPQ